VKKVGFAAGEVSLLRRRLHDPEPLKPDEKARVRVLEKLKRAEQPSDPGVNAPALERELIAYARGKVVAEGLPNWQKLARQGADVGATPADAQTVGTWMYHQGWLALGSQTLTGVLRNWSSWLGKARAAQQGQRPRAGINGRPDTDLGPGAGEQRPDTPGGRRPPGIR